MIPEVEPEHNGSQQENSAVQGKQLHSPSLSLSLALRSGGSGRREKEQGFGLTLDYIPKYSQKRTIRHHKVTLLG